MSYFPCSIYRTRLTCTLSERRQRLKKKAPCVMMCEHVSTRSYCSFWPTKILSTGLFVLFLASSKLLPSVHLKRTLMRCKCQQWLLNAAFWLAVKEHTLVFPPDTPPPKAATSTFHALVDNTSLIIIWSQIIGQRKPPHKECSWLTVRKFFKFITARLCTMTRAALCARDFCLE